MQTKTLMSNNARRRRLLGTVALVAALTATVTACSSSSSGASGQSVSRAVGIVLPVEPLTLDPCQTNEDATAWVLRQNVTQTLVTQNPDTHALEPQLATAWKQLDTTTWEFTLRTGVKFQDGSPFGAADVVNTVTRFMNTGLNCGSATTFFGDEKLTATQVSDNVVDIKTSVPDSILPLRTTFIDITTRTASATAADNAPVGTGPYQFVNWTHGSSITVKRFDGYWGPKPQVESAKYQWRDDSTIRAGMVTNNEADFAFSLDPQSNAGDLAVSYPENQVAFLRMDPTIAPLNDIRIRQAIGYAVDRNALISSVFKGIAQPATQIITPAVDGYNPNLQPGEFNLDKAKQLIAEAKAAGVDASRQITIIGRTDIYPNASEAMEAVQQMLTKAGFNVKLTMLDHTAWIKYLFKPFPAGRGPTILQALHGNQGGDAVFSLQQIYGTTGVQSTYGTPELDSLINTASNATGTTRSTDFQAAIAYINNTEVRDVYIAQMKAIVAISKRIHYKATAATDTRLPLSEFTFANP